MAAAICGTSANLMGQNVAISLFAFNIVFLACVVTYAACSRGFFRTLSAMWRNHITNVEVRGEQSLPALTKAEIGRNLEVSIAKLS